MFDVCDWNDSSAAQSLTQSLQNARGTDSGAQPEGLSSSRKKRKKRTHQLLEILRTLESPRDPDPQPGAPQPSHPENPTPGDEQRKRPPRAVPGRPPPCVRGEPPLTDGEPRLSRQQWRNKQKRKKQTRNKFRTAAQTGEGGGEGAGEGGGEGGEASGGGCEEERCESLPGDGRPEKHGAAQGDRTSVPPALQCPSALPRGGQKVTAVERWRLQKLKRILQREEMKSAGCPGEGAGVPGEGAGGPGEGAGGPGEGENPGREDTAGSEVATLPGDRSASLRARMELRLQSARFRYINQQLYTSDSREAHSLFQGDPEAFVVYHRGFAQQVQRWPVNPITEIIKYIKNRPPSLVVADFGCGDAQLARSVRNQVHSFDLVALNDQVTACDMAKVPLLDETVDVAVFCLSLMGKNIVEFLQEANRVLKLGGVLLVAEVSSRFDDVRPFLSAMSHLGFKNIAKSTDSSYFFLFEFSKNGSGRDQVTHPGLELRPCLYKKR